MAKQNGKCNVGIKTAGDHRYPGQRVLDMCHWVVLLAFTFMALLAQGCASAPPRNPLPQNLEEQSQVPGIPYARYWGDQAPPFADRMMNASTEELRQRFSALYGQQLTILAISGGGQNGAFGAGLLNGWTAAGTRPQFSVVTGISTGALIAPFAYLGPAYDVRIREMYTKYSTKDLLEIRSMLNMINNDAAVDTKLLRSMIVKYFDEAVMQAIAAEYRKGRLLFIGTTNLDAERAVTWNIGAIAMSGLPGALDLIHDVMLASASIPVAFPPVMIEVEANGQRYDEMHVDGGTVRQSFLFSFGVDNKALAQRLNVKGQARAYVIRNAKLEPVWETVDPKIFAIAGRSASSMIRSQGIGDLYREYQGTRQYGFDFNLAHIPHDFDLKEKEAFDPVYMGKLFELGYNMAKDGYPWIKAPPGVKPE